MNRDNIQTVSSERFQGWLHFRLQHCDVASYASIIVGANKCPPGIQSHSGINLRSHFFHIQVVSANGDLVDGTILLSRMAHNLCDFIRIERGLLGSGGWGLVTGGWLGVADE